MRNCILWGNSGGEISDNGSASTTVSDSIVQQASGVFTGTGNLNTDPLFITPITVAAPTTTGNLRLRSGSPAINAGSNSVTNPTQGARAVGMIGIHLSDLPPNPIADYTIPSDSLHHVTLIVEETCSPAGAEEWSSERGGPRLLEPWPNPSANEVRLRFVAPGAPSAELGIFDAQGRRVATFLDRRAVGEFVWNGSGSDGIPIASGVYFARLQVGDRFDQVKLLRLDRR